MQQDFGKFVLRLTLGGLMLFHGIAKIISGPSGIIGIVSRAGFPEFFGYFVYVGEVVAPLLLIVGVLTRPAALVIVLNMVVAVFLAHSGHFFALTQSGGWRLELQAFYFFTAIVVACLGAGRFSVGGKHGKWN